MNLLLGYLSVLISFIQFSSVTQLCLTLCDPMNCSTPGLPVHHQLLEFTQTHLHWVSDAIQPSHPLSSPSPPTFNLSQHQGLFQWVRWPKYWSFSFNISPSSEYSGLISFRMDWLDLFAVQRTLKSLLQHHSSKASILRCSAFFGVQLSYPYMPTGKTITFTFWHFRVFLPYVGQRGISNPGFFSFIQVTYTNIEQGVAENLALPPALQDPAICLVGHL